MSCDPFICPWCDHQSHQNEESFEVEKPHGSVFVCERCFDEYYKPSCQPKSEGEHKT